MTFAAFVLAHQGGWDEAALIGVPIVVIVVVLAIAKRRVDAAVSAERSAVTPPSDE